MQAIDRSGEQPALSVRRLSLAYGPVKAIDDVSLTVERGQFVALLGPSGCGKTSLLRSVAGFAHPQAGEIRIEGIDVLKLQARQRNIGMVFQHYALFPHMTAAQNIAFGLRCRHTPEPEQRQRVSDILDVVGLKTLGDRRPAQLSGGQQQRVALARALVIQPDLLLLDEALGALDKKLRVQMQTELKELQRRFGISTIFVTHDQEEAMAMADLIAVMRDGRIEQLDSPRELFLKPRNGWVADFMGVGNVLTGELVSATGAASRLDLGPGTSFEAPGGSSGRASLYIRADRVVLATAGEESPVEVVGRRFLGAHVEIRVRAPNFEAKALAPVEAADAFPIGHRVSVGARAEDVRVLQPEDAT